MSRERVIVDAADFVGQAETWIVEKLKSVLETSEYCHLMLAGGGTPLPVYKRLAERSDIPWGRIRLYFGDERCVPVNTPQSNAFTVLDSLFHGAPPEGLTVYRMCGEEEPDKAAQEYEAILPERMDILLLGVGEDGHTASIFPGSAALDEERRRVMPVIGSKPPRQRLTVTPSVIQQARHVLVMVQGEDKADAVRWALLDGCVPAALAVEGDWILDRQAARSLPKDRPL
ncbi:MAG: 6-phosphogluconolactonase [Candidatus Thiodiazotropha sp.]